MGDIVPVEPVGITEDCSRLFEWDTVFLEIGNGLRDVPRKHATVYTVIRLSLQSSYGTRTARRILKMAVQRGRSKRSFYSLPISGEAAGVVSIARTGQP